MKTIRSFTFLFFITHLLASSYMMSVYMDWLNALRLLMLTGIAAVFGAVAIPPKKVTREIDDSYPFGHVLPVVLALIIAGSLLWNLASNQSTTELGIILVFFGMGYVYGPMMRVRYENLLDGTII